MRSPTAAPTRADRIIAESQKPNLEHPNRTQHPPLGLRVPVDERAGTVEMHLKADDALIFTNGATHGTNPGDRRVIIFRYGPSWGACAFGYQYSDELLTSQELSLLQLQRFPFPVGDP